MFVSDDAEKWYSQTGINWEGHKRKREIGHEAARNCFIFSHEMVSQVQSQEETQRETKENIYYTHRS